MRLLPTLTWQIGESAEPLDPRLMPLLEAIAASASLSAAVAECHVSYRAAWGLLREYEGKLGVALVLLERGRGASLTPAGERLLEVRRNAAERLSALLPKLAADIGPAAKVPVARIAPKLRIAASHDLALAALSEMLAQSDAVAADISFLGSVPALEAFAQGEADLAGFHVPITGCTGMQRGVFTKWLHARRDRLIRFVDREQGLILPRGNPAQVRTFRDVAAKTLRFVNRQRGSGTRLLIDRMLADARLEAARINGYRTEEFTHAAVAATVASGGADVGFGIRAAAAEYRLGFVPLARERYFLAVHARNLKSDAMSRLVDVLRSASFKRIVRRLPGYVVDGAGTVVNVDAIDTTR